MEMNKIIMFLFLLHGCTGMEKNGGGGKKVEEIRIERSLKPSELIRNPLGESGLDTSNVAKLIFKENKIVFGQVKEGELVKKTFTFTNNSKHPLYILEAFSTCGCTVPTWPKEMIKPGGGGVIEVVFNTEGKIKEQRKAITIIANTFPSETVVYLEGYVNPKN
jgi:hypothetical protein